MGKVVLNADKISKSYRSGNYDLEVLNNFSINVKMKDIITISGQSGCGKSTALNILGTLDKADSGQLTIMDRDISELNKKEIATFRNVHIGFMFQFHHLLNEFTAIENVLIPTWINKEYQKKEYAKELFDILGISNRMKHLPSQLSGGERSRISLIRALINTPDILFADEPTGNLDKKNSLKLIDLLCQINTDLNQTIILTTHNPDVASIGNRLYYLDNGFLIKK